MIETFRIEVAPGVELACRAAGPAEAPRVLLLHGFPEAAFVWDEVMQRVAPQARCVAPNLRGYGESSAPVELDAYKARTLVGDLVALIGRLGAPIDLLVAHDWGGALAWKLAAQRPELLKRLLILNAPHPATFLRELRDSPAQQAASAYMNFLCRPDAEARLAEDDFARIRRFFGAARWLTPELGDRYREVWQRGLNGPLNYYRASPLRPPAGADSPILKLRFDDAAVTVPVPTTVLWGEADAALLPRLLDGLERWVPKLELKRVPEASHWIVHEQPDRVAGEILSQLPRAA